MAETDALENLLIKIGEILVERRKKPTEKTPEEEPTTREKFIDMYSAETLNKVNPFKPKYQQESTRNPLKYVVIKPKATDNVVLQQMEGIQKDREEAEKSKAEMEKERLHIQSQQQQLRSAFDEARRKQIM
jgi:hypothetical protein